MASGYPVGKGQCFHYLVRDQASRNRECPRRLAKAMTASPVVKQTNMTSKEGNGRPWIDHRQSEY